MTISTTENRESYVGDGSSTVFQYPYQFIEPNDIIVYVGGVLMSSGYTVGSPTPMGANVTFSTAPAPGVSIVLINDPDLLQQSALPGTGPFPSPTVEAMSDKLTLIVQRLRDLQDRSFTLNDADVSGASVTLPSPEANQFIGWNSTADALQNIDPSSLITIVGSSGFSYQLFSGNGSTVNFTLSSNPGSLGNLEIFISGVCQTPLSDYNFAGTILTFFSPPPVGSNNILVRWGTTLGIGVPSDGSVTSEKIAPGTILTNAKNSGGRLTLTSGTPVTATNVTGATTIYFTPYKGNAFPLYDGANWSTTSFAELSQLTTDTTKSPAAVANNSNYDMLVWNDGGTIRCTRGPAWSSDTSRGTGAGTTELELFDGVYVNKIAITNGPAARRGLYVGTIRSDGSAQINDSLTNRHVWNNFNRVCRPMTAIDTADTWTYSTAAFRQANNSTANQIDFVLGLNEDCVFAEVRTLVSTSTSTARFTTAGIGLDSATVNSARIIMSFAATNVSVISGPSAIYSDHPGLGRHFLAWLEYGAGADTQTWGGDVGSPGQQQAGIVGQIFS